jgi:hypothetical protein
LITAILVTMSAMYKDESLASCCCPKQQPDGNARILQELQKTEKKYLKREVWGVQTKGGGE